MADEPKKKRARKPRGRKFEDVFKNAEEQSSSASNLPLDSASPARQDVNNYEGESILSRLERIRRSRDAIIERIEDKYLRQEFPYEAIQNIRKNIDARLAGREGMGLREDVTPEMREQRLQRIGPSVVVVNGEAIQLPKDYRERKKFRKYRLEEMQRIGRRRKEDRKTRRQLQGGLGRLGYGAGRGAARVRAALPDMPMPSARNPLVRFGLRYGKNIGGVRGGLAGLGALAGGALIGKAIQAFGEDREAEAQRQEMLRRQARQDMLDMLGRKEQKRALQMSIDDNLAKLQAQAPDLYMRVASGRLLPQGAVVIGGVPRQDLLNQLGMAMSNGQFSE